MVVEIADVVFESRRRNTAVRNYRQRCYTARACVSSWRITTVPTDDIHRDRLMNAGLTASSPAEDVPQNITSLTVRPSVRLT